MSSRGFVKSALFAVLFVNLLLVVDMLSLGLFVPSVRAEEEAAAAEPLEERAETGLAEHQRSVEGSLGAEIDEAVEERRDQVYKSLLTELGQQKERLDARQSELVERERQLVVVRRELDKRLEEIEKMRRRLEAERQRLDEESSPSFERLLKAYEGMEAENAAGALEQLYGQQAEVVVDLLLGLKPRQAGAVLDALAARNPKLAADLSEEIWRRDPGRRR